jgi:hypothetical protein
MLTEAPPLSKPTTGNGWWPARRPTKATVHWYGGGDRRVELVSDTGQQFGPELTAEGWYKTGQGLIPIRWVFVHDRDGTHRDEYFYTSDPELDPAQIISWFTALWPIETTFQEVRAHLGFQTTRQRVAKSVLRTTPCLLGLFSLVSLIFVERARRHSIRVRCTAWYTTTGPTFSDALATVRRLFWSETGFQHCPQHEAFRKLPRPIIRVVLERLSLTG